VTVIAVHYFVIGDIVFTCPALYVVTDIRVMEIASSDSQTINHSNVDIVRLSITITIIEKNGVLDQYFTRTLSG
ncbi:MAG: hypothetical protein ACE1ZI_07200, partial [Acidobacteriota bacterium]